MDASRKNNEAARLRRIARRQDPSYQAKRNFDNNGNRLYHGVKGEFMAQNPQYVGRRFHNPKGPDGKPSYTEAGLAYENFYDQKHPNRYRKTKADKTGERGAPRVQAGAASLRNQNVGPAGRMFIAPDPNDGYASSHVDSGVVENARQGRLTRNSRNSGNSRMLIAPDPNDGYASSHVDSGVVENAGQGKPTRNDRNFGNSRMAGEVFNQSSPLSFNL